MAVERGEWPGARKRMSGRVFATTFGGRADRTPENGIRAQSADRKHKKVELTRQPAGAPCKTEGRSDGRARSLLRAAEGAVAPTDRWRHPRTIIGQELTGRARSTCMSGRPRCSGRDPKATSGLRMEPSCLHSARSAALELVGASLGRSAFRSASKRGLFRIWGIFRVGLEDSAEL